jgi:hypothetical protein
VNKVPAKPWASGTERSKEALDGFPHVTPVSEGCRPCWLPRHESGLLVGFDVRATVSDPAG